jgi:hypothetical protein
MDSAYLLSRASALPCVFLKKTETVTKTSEVKTSNLTQGLSSLWKPRLPAKRSLFLFGIKYPVVGLPRSRFSLQDNIVKVRYT